MRFSQQESRKRSGVDIGSVMGTAPGPWDSDG
jgi:hypothetical protein